MRTSRLLVALVLGLSQALLGGAAVAADAGVSAASAGRPLPPLPSVQEPRLPAAEPAALARLDALLERLVVRDAAVRTAAGEELTHVAEDWLPALAARLDILAGAADKLAMKELLSGIRQDARDRLRREQRARGDMSAVVTPDYLTMLLDYEPRGEKPLAPLTQVVAMSRMLERIGNVQAVRQLIRVYVRFGDFLRVDTQLALARLGERATAALLEATRHPAPLVARWADEQLEALGKSSPSDAVQVADASVLPDILRAYGRAQKLDTARLLISYAESERAQVRQAAREGITLLGSAASWQLRDAYEKLVGKRPSLAWKWERTARELFAELDQRRLSEIYGLFSEGKAAAERGDLRAARKSYDRVLAWDPSFHEGEAMAATYLEFARRYTDEATAEARSALLRAERLVPEGELHQHAASLRYTLDAEELLRRGIVDRVLLQRALDADRGNERARALEQRLLRSVTGGALWFRYRAVAGLAALGLFAVAFMALRHRRRDREAAATGV